MSPIPSRRSKNTKKSTPKLSKKFHGFQPKSFIFVLLVVLNLTELFLATSPPLFKYERMYNEKRNKFNCYADRTLFYIMRVTEYSAKPISVNLNTIAIPESDKYITDTDGNKRYGVYEPGGNCFYHTDRAAKNANPAYILVIQNSGDSVANCRVSRIITNNGLKPCSGMSTEDFFSVIQLKISNQVSGTINNFVSATRDKNFDYQLLQWAAYRFSDFSLPNLDERFFELLLIRGLGPRNPEGSVSVFDYQAINRVNNQISLNSFASPLNGGEVIKRLVQDDLPGYYLGVYSGQGDDTSKFLQAVSRENPYYQHSVLMQGYIAKPSLLSINEPHTLELSTKSYRHQTTQDPLGIKQHNYKIITTRRANQIDFEVKRRGINIMTLSHSYSGGDKFIYFTLVVGGGVLYFIDPEAVRVKYYESFHIYEVGQTVQRELQTFEESTTISRIIIPKSNSSPRVWMKVEYKPPTGVTQNTPGYRIMTLKIIRGAYPQYLLSNIDVSLNFPRCYYHSGSNRNCFSMALLSDAEEVQTLSYASDEWYRAKNMVDSDMIEMCRVAYDDNRCLLPRSGYIVNLDKSSRSPVGAYGKLRLEDYEKLSPDLKNFVYLFENNVGTKYMVSCPNSCKLRWI